MLFIGHCILNGGQCGENHTDGRRNGDQEEHGGSVLTGAGTTVIAQEICAALQGFIQLQNIGVTITYKVVHRSRQDRGDTAGQLRQTLLLIPADSLVIKDWPEKNTPSGR